MDLTLLLAICVLDALSTQAAPHEKQTTGQQPDGQKTSYKSPGNFTTYAERETGSQTFIKEKSSQEFGATEWHRTNSETVVNEKESDIYNETSRDGQQPEEPGSDHHPAVQKSGNQRLDSSTIKYTEREAGSKTLFKAEKLKTTGTTYRRRTNSETVVDQAEREKPDQTTLDGQNAEEKQLGNNQPRYQNTAGQEPGNRTPGSLTTTYTVSATDIDSYNKEQESREYGATEWHRTNSGTFVDEKESDIYNETSRDGQQPEEPGSDQHPAVQKSGNQRLDSSTIKYTERETGSKTFFKAEKLKTTGTTHRRRTNSETVVDKAEREKPDQTTLDGQNAEEKQLGNNQPRYQNTADQEPGNRTPGSLTTTYTVSATDIDSYNKEQESREYGATEWHRTNSGTVVDEKESDIYSETSRDGQQPEEPGSDHHPAIQKSGNQRLDSSTIKYTEREAGSKTFFKAEKLKTTGTKHRRRTNSETVVDQAEREKPDQTTLDGQNAEEKQLGNNQPRYQNTADQEPGNRTPGSLTTTYTVSATDIDSNNKEQESREYGATEWHRTNSATVVDEKESDIYNETSRDGQQPEEPGSDHHPAVQKSGNQRLDSSTIKYTEREAGSKTFFKAEKLKTTGTTHRRRTNSETVVDQAEREKSDQTSLDGQNKEEKQLDNNQPRYQTTAGQEPGNRTPGSLTTTYTVSATDIDSYNKEQESREYGATEWHRTNSGTVVDEKESNIYNETSRDGQQPEEPGSDQHPAVQKSGNQRLESSTIKYTDREAGSKTFFKAEKLKTTGTTHRRRTNSETVVDQAEREKPDQTTLDGQNTEEKQLGNNQPRYQNTAGQEPGNRTPGSLTTTYTVSATDIDSYNKEQESREYGATEWHRTNSATVVDEKESDIYNETSRDGQQPEEPGSDHHPAVQKSGNQRLDSSTIKYTEREAGSKTFFKAEKLKTTGTTHRRRTNSETVVDQAEREKPDQTTHNNSNPEETLPGNNQPRDRQNEKHEVPKKPHEQPSKKPEGPNNEESPKEPHDHLPKKDDGPKKYKKPCDHTSEKHESPKNSHGPPSERPKGSNIHEDHKIPHDHPRKTDEEPKKHKKPCDHTSEKHEGPKNSHGPPSERPKGSNIHEDHKIPHDHPLKTDDGAKKYKKPCDHTSEKHESPKNSHGPPSERPKGSNIHELPEKPHDHPLKTDEEPKKHKKPCDHTSEKHKSPKNSHGPPSERPKGSNIHELSKKPHDHPLKTDEEPKKHKKPCDHTSEKHKSPKNSHGPPSERPKGSNIHELPKKPHDHPLKTDEEPKKHKKPCDHTSEKHKSPKNSHGPPSERPKGSNIHELPKKPHDHPLKTDEEPKKHKKPCDHTSKKHESRKNSHGPPSERPKGSNIHEDPKKPHDHPLKTDDGPNKYKKPCAHTSEKHEGPKNSHGPPSERPKGSNIHEDHKIPHDHPRKTDEEPKKHKKPCDHTSEKHEGPKNSHGPPSERPKGSNIHEDHKIPHDHPLKTDDGAKKYKKPCDHTSEKHKSPKNSHGPPSERPKGSNIHELPKKPHDHPLTTDEEPKKHKKPCDHTSEKHKSPKNSHGPPSERPKGSNIHELPKKLHDHPLKTDEEPKKHKKPCDHTSKKHESRKNSHGPPSERPKGSNIHELPEKPHDHPLKTDEEPKKHKKPCDHTSEKHKSPKNSHGPPSERPKGSNIHELPKKPHDHPLKTDEEPKKHKKPCDHTSEKLKSPKNSHGPPSERPKGSNIHEDPKKPHDHPLKTDEEPKKHKKPCDHTSEKHKSPKNSHGPPSERPKGSNIHEDPKKPHDLPLKTDDGPKKILGNHKDTPLYKEQPEKPEEKESVNSDETSPEGQPPKDQPGNNQSSGDHPASQKPGNRRPGSTTIFTENEAGRNTYSEKRNLKKSGVTRWRRTKYGTAVNEEGDNHKETSSEGQPPNDEQPGNNQPSGDHSPSQKPGNRRPGSTTIFTENEAGRNTYSEKRNLKKSGVTRWRRTKYGTAVNEEGDHHKETPPYKEQPEKPDEEESDNSDETSPEGQPPNDEQPGKNQPSAHHTKPYQLQCKTSCCFCFSSYEDIPKELRDRFRIQ